MGDVIVFEAGHAIVKTRVAACTLHACRRVYTCGPVRTRVQLYTIRILIQAAPFTS